MACGKEQALRRCPGIEDGSLLLLPDIEDGSRLAPMHRLHDPGGALLATLPQWPRIKPFTCSQCRHGLHAGHREIPSPVCVVYGVIHAASGLTRENRRHIPHLDPDCGRVTTVLPHCVVTRPLSQGSRYARRMPVTPAAYKQICRS